MHEYRAYIMGLDGHIELSVVLGRVLITRRSPVLQAKRKCSARSEHYRS